MSQRAYPCLTLATSLGRCSGPEASIPNTALKKCSVKTSLGGRVETLHPEYRNRSHLSTAHKRTHLYFSDEDEISCQRNIEMCIGQMTWNVKQ